MVEATITKTEIQQTGKVANPVMRLSSQDKKAALEIKQFLDLEDPISKTLFILGLMNRIPGKTEWVIESLMDDIQYDQSSWRTTFVIVSSLVLSPVGGIRDFPDLLLLLRNLWGRRICHLLLDLTLSRQFHNEPRLGQVRCVQCNSFIARDEGLHTEFA
eukprot:1119350-Prymnesium_polylepis.1